MISNLERYKKDLNALIEKGNELELVIQLECFPEQVKKVKQELGKEADNVLKDLPSFSKEYQSWYSEAKMLIKQLLPERLSDFVRYYEKPKPRKDISYENYRIEDYFQGLTVTRGYSKEKVVGPEAAIPHF